MGDREVVREAVAKGLHVEWAQLFLASRKHLDPKETDKWFKTEVRICATFSPKLICTLLQVFLWVSELLSRKQVFKASHILTNIKLDAPAELAKLFSSTQDIDLRDYLGNHLVKIGKLEEAYQAAWRLLVVIEENRVHLNVYDKLTVQEIYDKDWNWKCEIGTHLYFLTYGKCFFLLLPT